MTDEWRLEPLVARVVAWHNRHPLARRITTHQVLSLGFVALPYARPLAAADDHPALAPARHPASSAADASPSVAVAGSDNGVSGVPRSRGLKAVFSEKFINSLAPRRVARWGARHARRAATVPVGGPIRQVTVDDARLAFGEDVMLLYAMTAAVQASGARRRLLLGPDPAAPVLGRRLWSRPRVAAFGAGLAAVLALLALAGAPRAPASFLPSPTLQAAAPAPPASAASAPVPPDAEPRLGRIQLPPPVPPIDVATRAAARLARQSLPARTEAPAAPRTAAAATMTATAPAGPAASDAAAPAATAWAVSTRPLRTRAESGQMRAALGELLREQGHDGVRVEMLPAGDDWRVVGWPFKHRADAERARAMLVARGLRVELVEF